MCPQIFLWYANIVITRNQAKEPGVVGDLCVIKNVAIMRNPAKQPGVVGDVSPNLLVVLQILQL